MANNLYSLLAFLFITNIVVSFAVAGRDIPAESKNEDKKQPEFLHFDGSVLIPGIGRVIVPKGHKKGYKKGFNPFPYNPITGTGAPTIGSGGGGAGRGYVPGGDDTLVPNPGVEIPIPGSGGSIPSAASP